VEPSWRVIKYRCPICGALLAIKLRDRKVEFADQVISVRECEHFVARKVQEGYNEDVDFFPLSPEWEPYWPIAEKEDP